MGWIEIVSLVLNLLLGGGLMVTLRTMQSIKIEAAANAKKAQAEAQKSEITNVDAVSKMWRELAEKMAEKHHDLVGQVEELHVEVRRLKNATNRVVRLLDRLTPENMEETIGIIKKEIDDEHTSVSRNLSSPVNRVQGTTADN